MIVLLPYCGGDAVAPSVGVPLSLEGKVAVSRQPRQHFFRHHESRKPVEVT